MVSISPFSLLNRVSVWAVKVDEEQSIVTFLVPPFFPQVFSMFLSLNITELCMLNEMNQIIK